MMLELLPYGVGAVLALLVAFGGIGAQFISAPIWFGGIALFAIPQIYLIPIAGIYPSLCLLAALGPVFALKQLPHLWQQSWFKAFIALFSIHAASLAWSPSPYIGLRQLVYFSPFPIAACIGFAVASKHTNYAKNVIGIALSLSVLQALLVMLFRVSPSIEAAFISSRLAGITTSPNVIAALFDGSPNNIFDATKAGGLFVNANTASAFLGFCSMLAWYLSANAGLKHLKAVAVINWAAVFFTGSKAGMILAVCVPSLTFALAVIRTRQIELKIATALFFLAAVATLLVPFAVEHFLDSGFVGATSSTLDVRQVIWSFAQQEFLKAPLQGMGFGGWEMQFPTFAWVNRVSPLYPAHNAFLITWGQSGLLAAASLLAFVLLYLRWTFRCQKLADPFAASLSTGLFFGAFWFWGQAQGENFGILGEQHFTPLLGLLSGVLLAYVQKPTPTNPLERTL